MRNCYSSVVLVVGLCVVSRGIVAETKMKKLTLEKEKRGSLSRQNSITGMNTLDNVPRESNVGGGADAGSEVARASFRDNLEDVTSASGGSSSIPIRGKKKKADDASPKGGDGSTVVVSSPPSEGIVLNPMVHQSNTHEVPSNDNVSPSVTDDGGV